MVRKQYREKIAITRFARFYPHFRGLRANMSSRQGQLGYTLAMKKIEIKKFKTAPDLAKMIEEGHKVHAMANGKIQSYERHTPQPEDYSNLDDFMEVAENHINELYNTRQEVDEMLTEVFTVFVRHPELSGTPYITVLELMVFLEEDFRQLTKRYEAASSALAAMEENQYGCDDMDIYVGEHGARTMLDALDRLKKFGQLTNDEEGLESELKEGVANQSPDINWKQPRLN